MALLLLLTILCAGLGCVSQQPFFARVVDEFDSADVTEVATYVFQNPRPLWIFGSVGYLLLFVAMIGACRSWSRTSVMCLTVLAWQMLALDATDGMIVYYSTLSWTGRPPYLDDFCEGAYSHLMFGALVPLALVVAVLFISAICRSPTGDSYDRLVLLSGLVTSANMSTILLFFMILIEVFHWGDIVG